ncbi:MAG: flagellar motor switch protein FliN [Acidimicrobiales bacterium]
MTDTSVNPVMDTPVMDTPGVAGPPANGDGGADPGATMAPPREQVEDPRLNGGPIDSMTGQGSRSLELLHGVEMTVTVELGRTKMLVKDLLALRPGSIVELDRAAGSPVDVLINGTLLAHGQVVVIDDEFGVRITDVVSGDDAGIPG